MKNINQRVIFVCIALLFQLSFLAQAPSFQWAKRIGGAAGREDMAYSIKTDAFGNSYVTGFFNGVLDFDPSNVIDTITSQGNTIFLAKYNINGNLLWAKKIRSAGGGYGSALVLGTNGDIYITGTFSGITDFDPSAAIANLIPNSSSNNMFIAKYDSNGNYIWAKKIEMSASADCSGMSMAIDANNNINIGGGFSGTVDFDPSAAVANLNVGGTFLAKYDSNGNYLWANKFANVSIDISNCLSVDANGNLSVVGKYFGTADFDPSSSTANLASMGNHDIFIAKYDINGNYLYAKSIGGGANEEGRSITTDASGNILITGNFSATVDFDPSTAVANLSGGPSELFLAKYDVNGNYIWAKNMGGPSAYCSGNAIILDANNNAYVTGTFSGIADFDPSAGVANLTGGTIFLAKYDPNGNYIWANNMPGSQAIIYSMAIYNDNPYFAGSIQGPIDFDPSANTTTITSVIGHSFFVAKYDSAGNYVFAIASEDQRGGPDKTVMIKLDQFGNSYITGTFSGVVDFDPSSSVNILDAGIDPDIFIAKYDINGNYVWAKNINSNYYDEVYSLALDAAGNAYITGSFSGTSDFDPSSATSNLISAGGDDVFLAKYDAAGNYLWAQKMGGTGNDVAYALAINGNNEIVVAGTFYSTADFDPSAQNANLTSNGYMDIFLAKYDANGNYLFVKQIGGNWGEKGNGLAIDANNNIILGGNFETTVDFDPSSAAHNLSNSSSFDIVFIAKYDINGNYIWAKSINNHSGSLTSLIVEPNGNIYMAGIFSGTTDFDLSTNGTANLISTNGTAAVIIKYNNSANYIWAKEIGDDSGNVYVTGMAVDLSQKLYLTGSFNGTRDFDLSSNIHNLTSNGNADMFLTIADLHGDYVYAQNIGGILGDQASAIAIDNNDNLYLTGVFSETCDFDPTAGTDYLMTAGGEDIFITKYNKLTVGIKEIADEEKDAGLKIYPNPTTGDFIILANNLKENCYLEIYNCTGQLIDKKKVTDKEMKATLDGQASGMYFIKFVESGVAIQSLKIIKQ